MASDPTAVATLADTLRLQHEATLANVPETYKRNHEKLALDLALHMEPEAEVWARYGYTPEQAEALKAHAAFAALLARVEKEVRDTGLTFKAKVRSIAEGILPEAYAIATDETVSPAVRLDAVKWAAKMAGHEPKEKDGTGAGGGLTLNISFSGQAPQTVIQGETLTQEAG